MLSRYFLYGIFLMLFIFAYGCPMSNEEGDEEEVEKVSAIQPRPVFLSGKLRIPVTEPLYGVEINSPMTVTFEASGMSYGSFLIFNVEPTENDIKNGDLSGCVAGISSLAGHNWNGRTIDLSSGLYQCNPSDPMEPLTSTHLNVNSSNFPYGNYYWLFLGYDQNGIVTHSSSLILIKMNL